MSKPICKLCETSHWPRDGCPPSAVAAVVAHLSANGAAPPDIVDWVDEVRDRGHGERMPLVPFTPDLPLVVAMPHLADEVFGATKAERASTWLREHPEEAEAWRELGSPQDAAGWAASRGETPVQRRVNDATAVMKNDTTQPKATLPKTDDATRSKQQAWNTRNQDRVKAARRERQRRFREEQRRRRGGA